MEIFTYERVLQESLGPFISKIYLKPQSSSVMTYEAGQYIKVLHRNKAVSPLSIASAPNDLSMIELHLSHPAINKSACDILAMLDTEKKLSFRGPYGSCVFSKLDLNRPTIFFARETGFAPIKAIIEKCVHDKKFPMMHLYWSGENYLASLVEAWMHDIKQLSYTKLTTNAIAEKIAADYPDLTHYQVYGVDAGNVVHEVLFHLMENGLSREDFYSDVFDYNQQV